VPASSYCIDTSALIAAWYERYKPNRFPKLWSEFDKLIEDGRLVSSSLVLRECSRRSQELHDWLKQRSDMFVQPDEGIQTEVGLIINAYKGLVAEGKQKSSADPFIIAQAKVHRLIVVSEEGGAGSLRKIPGVCNALNMTCINLMQLMDREDWVLG
jgi:predicted nucleic acid-binding protein